MNITIIIGIVIGLILIFFAMFFAIAESVLEKIRVKKLIESDKNDHKLTNKWIGHATDLKAAAVIWHGLTVTGATVLISFFTFQYIEKGNMIAVVLVSALVLLVIFCDIAPRYIGTHYANILSSKIIPLLYFHFLATKYFNKIILKVSELIAEISGAKTNPFILDKDDTKITEDSDEEIDAEEHEMIKSIFEFGDTVVREVMIPRTEMDAIPSTKTLAEAIEIALKEGFSRLPVYNENIDDIIGIFYLRDALNFWNQRNSDSLPPLSEIIHKPFFIPETKKVNELLNEFKLSKIQLAIIVDEYGGTAGLATLEDILEEIVGEIHDEYDQEENAEYIKIDDNTFLLDATMSVDDVNDLADIDLPEEEDFDTIGGYAMFRLGRLPDENEIIEEKDFILKITKVTDRKVEQLELKKIDI